MRDSDTTRDAGGARGARLMRAAVGVESYPAICTRHYYYVDKTLLIRDVADRFGQSLLLARPPKFGKTLAMSTLRTFFEETDTDPAPYFEDKRIWQCGQEYRRRMGRFPVICLSFKEARKYNWDRALASLIYLLQLEYGRHASAMDMARLDPPSRARLDEIRRGTDLSQESFQYALADLAEILHRYYKVPPVLLIDECDAVVEEGWACGYKDAAVQFMGEFLSPALDANPHVSVACLFGVQAPVTPIPGLKVLDTLSSEMDGHFGFTAPEVGQIADYYACPRGIDELAQWYEAYRFGSQELYNPLSVMDYMQHGFIPNDYWVRACVSSPLSTVLEYKNQQVAEDLVRALQGGSIRLAPWRNGAYPTAESDPSEILSFLYANGYLTRARKQTGGPAATLDAAIPNKELRGVYVKQMVGSLDNRLRTSYRVLERAMRRNRMRELAEAIRNLLQETVETQDAFREDSYQNLIVGLAPNMYEDYVITSARAEDGARYSINMFPKWEGMPGILIEAQKARHADESAGEMADKAVERIDGSPNEALLRKRGVRTALKFGIGFGRNTVHVVAHELDFEEQD